MALKKPLVLTNGEVEQLQPGDYISEVDLVQLVNGEASTIAKGTPVYIFSADTCKKAKADAAGTSCTFGLVAASNITTGVAGGIQTNGVLAATTGEWDAITGGSGGLTANTKYYLSNATAGTLTSTPVSTGYSQRVGIAISSTELEIDIQQCYKL